MEGSEQKESEDRFEHAAAAAGAATVLKGQLRRCFSCHTPRDAHLRKKGTGEAFQDGMWSGRVAAGSTGISYTHEPVGRCIHVKKVEFVGSEYKSPSNTSKFSKANVGLKKQLYAESLRNEIIESI